MTRVPGMYGEIKLIAGSSTPELAGEISDYLSENCGQCIPLLDADIQKFANDNIFVQLNESVRGQDVYIIQTTGTPVNDNLMELLIALDAVRRDSAGRITAVIPSMAYSRTDKKDLPRTPITARLVADMIQIAGADRYMTIDLHAGQIQGFFNIPGDALTAMHIMTDYVRSQIPTDNLVVTTVDLGFAKGGRNWARALDVPLTFIEKKRVGARARARSLIGSVRGKNVLLVDDEMDTGGSMLQAVELLDEHGARDITIAFTHAVFSDPVHENLRKMQPRVREFICTNTIPVPEEHRLPNMTVLTVAELLEVLNRRAHEGISVGAMFDE